MYFDSRIDDILNKYFIIEICPTTTKGNIKDKAPPIQFLHDRLMFRHLDLTNKFFTY